MESFELVELQVTWKERTFRLGFSSAQLVVVTDLGSRQWYVDVNGVPDRELLADFDRSGDLRIGLRAVTAGGRQFEGTGYLHPNLPSGAAAIRGDDALQGYK